MDDESSAVVHKACASGMETDSTFAEALTEFHISSVHVRQSAESVSTQASLTAEFGSLIWADTAGGQSPLGSPCSRRVLG